MTSVDPDQLASSEVNWSGSTLLRQGILCSAREGLRMKLQMYVNSSWVKTDITHQISLLFVYVEVLWSSQPNGLMSSAASLPNHTLSGLDESSKRLTSIVLILSPLTDNCPSWISGRARLTVENSSWSISTEENLLTSEEVEPTTSWSPVGRASNWTKFQLDRM